MKKKNCSTTLPLSRHGGEELELAGEYGEWLGWQEEEGGTMLIWMSSFSPGWCYEPRLKGTEPGLKGGRLQQPFRVTATKGL
jgi:hypothetical protein